MIKPQELRIGSTVWLKSKGKPYTIASGHDIDEGIDSDDFEPVPLTEEWLLKFGFENVKVYFYYYQFDIAIYYNGDEFIFNRDSQQTIINTVHQLQNLYFALTGEELQLKK